MHFEIKHRWTGAVLFECELDASFETKSHSIQLGAAVKLAVKARANLSQADLSGADLSGADLSWADISWADLSGADLSGANFDIPLATPEQAIANLDQVREIILEDQGRLRMEHWHEDDGWQKRTCAEEAVCGTTHCLAGWLQVCATDERVRKIEPRLAGMLQAPVAAKMFIATNRRALGWLAAREYAKEAA